MKKGVKIAIIVGVVVVILIGVMGVAVSKISGKMQEAMEAMDADMDTTYKVAKQDLRQEIVSSGTVVGIEENAYTSPVTAKVDEIRVQVGEIVKKGDVLLTYDTADLGDNLAKVKIQAQSERASGNASYEAADEAKDKTSDAKKKVKKLKKQVADAKSEVEKVNDQITAAQNDLDDVETYNAREQAKAEIPKEDGTMYQPVLKDTKELKLKIQALNKELTKKSETLTDKQTKLAEQQGVVSANKDVKVSSSTKAQISAANQLSEMNVNDAQESLDAAEAGITANESGIVSSISAVKGAYASETQTLLTIIDKEAIGVEFSIAKDDLGIVTEGKKARVVIGENEYIGTVEFISHVAVDDMLVTGGKNGNGGTIKGRILLDNPDDNIFIGVSAKVYILIGEVENALAVPYEALNSDIDGDFVYVVNDENIIERRDVTTGMRSDEYYEILDGIAEGDKVITDVTKNMKPGDEYVAPNAMVMQ